MKISTVSLIASLAFLSGCVSTQDNTPRLKLKMQNPEVLSINTWTNPNELRVGLTDKVSKDTPLMSTTTSSIASFKSMEGALSKSHKMFKGSQFTVLEVQDNKHGNPDWYRVSANGAKDGWVKVIALYGQDIVLSSSVQAGENRYEYYKCGTSLFRVNLDAAENISPNADAAVVANFWGEVNELNNVKISSEWVKVIRNLMGTEATFFINRKGGDSFSSMSTMFGVQKENFGVCDNSIISDDKFN